MQKGGYLGNVNLRPAGVKVDYTQEQLHEFMKCAEDVIYFIENYVKIVSLDHGVVPFKLYEYQKRFVKEIVEHSRIAGLMPRQMGKTQTSAAVLLHYLIFNDSYTIAILANKASQSREIMSRLQLMYEYLPSWLQHGIKAWNKGDIELDNGSKAFSAATSASAIRGKSCVVGKTIVEIRDTKTGEEDSVRIDWLKFLLDETEKDFYENSNYEVKTPSGWSKFKGLIERKDREVISLTEHDLICTPCHLVKIDGEWVAAGELQHEKQENRESVYDLFEVSDGNEYLTNGLVSHNCNMLFIDEMAHIDNNKAEDFFVSSYPTISSGKNTKIIITSTPNGYNLFWKFWDGALKGTNGFVPCSAEWHENPNRDDKWLQDQKKVLGEVKANQEIFCSFIGSSNTLVNGTFLSRISTIAPEFSNDGVDILIPPDKTKSYVTCVDVSRGLSGDFSTAVVIDISEMPYKVAAKYRSNEITPLLFPSVIRRLAMDYNQSLVLIELNDAGEQVANILFNDLEYENILSTYTERGKQFPTFSGSGKTRPGLVTSKSTKSIGCSQLKILVEETKLLINDSDILAELSTFIESKGSYAADSGYHDDLVMPLVSFGWLSSTELFKQLVNSDIRNSIYASRQQQIESGLTPFGFVDDGTGVSTYQDQDGFTWVAKGDPDDIRNFRDNLMSRYEHDADFDKWFAE